MYIITTIILRFDGAGGPDWGLVLRISLYLKLLDAFTKSRHSCVPLSIIVLRGLRVGSSVNGEDDGCGQRHSLRCRIGDAAL